MRKILMMAMALLLGGPTAAWAQQVDVESLQKRETKSNADIANPKKQGAAATWVERGKLYLDAAMAPSGALYNNMTQKEVDLLMSKDKPQKTSETIDKVKYDKWQYPYVDVYLANEKVSFWLTTKEVLADAPAKSFEAYQKAYDLDKAAKVKDGMTRLGDFYKQTAQNLFAAHKYPEAAKDFQQAYDVQIHPAIGVIDTASLFNAGYLYTLANDYQNGATCLEEVEKYGYENKGDIYYLLYYCYNGLKQMDKAKNILLEGLKKYPDNTNIVEYLVNHYATTGENPMDIIPIVQGAVDKNPKNPNLWAGLGRVYDKLGEPDKAIEAFTKAAELTPNDFTAQYNLGLLYAKKAEGMAKKLNENPPTSNKAYNDEVDKVLNVFAQAVPPLEKALAINPKDANTLDLLKNLTFRLRDQPGMQEKNDKYKAMLDALSAQ